MTITINSYVACGVATIIILLGDFISKKISFLRKFCIPIPIIGGLVFSFILSVGHFLQIYELNIDTHFSDFFMLIFYAGVGFNAKFKTLINGGKKLLIFLFLSIILVFFQNLIGIIIADLFSIDRLIGLACSSVALTGGHGTSAAFAKVFEENGLSNAISITFAASTFGLILGGTLGGPIGRYLIEKKPSKNYTLQREYINEKKAFFHNASKIKNAAFYLLLAVSLGNILSNLFQNIEFVLPASVGTMIASGLLTNLIKEEFVFSVPLEEIQLISNISLLLFLALATLTIKPWQIIDLAIPLIFILVVQSIFMAIYAIWIVYPALGSDYEAAVISSGHCGFGLGVIATSIANMTTLEKQYGNCRNAIICVSLVGSLFINFFNSIIITAFLNYII